MKWASTTRMLANKPKRGKDVEIGSALLEHQLISPRVTRNKGEVML